MKTALILTKTVVVFIAGVLHPLSAYASPTDSIRIGVFPPQNQSSSLLRDQHLDAIVNLLERELISRKVVNVVELDHMKEMWATRGPGEMYPDKYDKRQLLQYGKVCQINYGLWSTGVLSNNIIVFTTSIVELETAIKKSAASGFFELDKSPSAYSNIVKQMVDTLLVAFNSPQNHPPYFTQLGSVAVASPHDEPLQLIIRVHDDDNDSVEIYMRPMAGATLKELGQGVATLTYAPPNEYVGRTIYFNVYATDGKSEISGSISVHILDYPLNVAKPPGRRWSVGLSSGISNWDIYLPSGSDLPAITTITFGGFSRWYLTNVLSVQPEMHYYRKGSEGGWEYVSTRLSTAEHFRFELEYLSVNILFAISNSRMDRVRFKFLIGPYWAPQIYSDYKYTDSLGFTALYRFDARSDMGIMLGIGFEAGGYGSGGALVTVDARFVIGMKRIWSGSPPSSSASELNGKNIGGLVVVGFGI